MANEQEPTAEVEAGAKGGKKKLILIGVVALFLLINGGLAAFFLLGGDDEDTDVTAEEVEEVEFEVEGTPTYHELRPAFVVNLPPGGKAKMLQVGVQVYTTDPDVVEKLTAHDPMLRHHLFDVFAAQPADTLYTREGRAELQSQIKDELIAKLESVGEQQVAIKSVYFTQFVLQ